MICDRVLRFVVSYVRGFGCVDDIGDKGGSKGCALGFAAGRSLCLEKSTFSSSSCDPRDADPVMCSSCSDGKNYAFI